MLGSVLVLLLVYWVPATLYTIADVLRPAWLYKYKVGANSVREDLKKHQVQNPASQHSTSTSALFNTVGLVLFNQVEHSQFSLDSIL